VDEVPPAEAPASPPPTAEADFDIDDAPDLIPPQAGSRPVPRNLLIRPLPRRLPPIERDVEFKADPNVVPEGKRLRGRGRGRGRDRRDRGRDDGPPPSAAPIPSVIEAAAPAPVPSPSPAPAAIPVEGATPHAPALSQGGPPHGRGRRRRRGRGRGRDRDHDNPAPVPPPPAPVPSAASHVPAPTVAPVRPAPPPPPARSPAAPTAAPVPGPDVAQWLAGPYRRALEKSPERKPAFRTSTGDARPPLAAPDAALVEGFARDVGFPGEFPFTRGVQPSMYRGRLWTMRQYAGFSTAAETNRRFRYLLERGQTGLSIAFDLPTQIGYDSDDPRAEGEVGKVGVPVNSLADMETVLEGIPLDRVTVSMTINATAPILVAMVAAVAKRRGIPLSAVGGTVQNDLLKEFVARNTYRFPVEPSLRLSTDLVRFCVEEMPKWNPVSVSGYHMREAGCDAAQEVAFTLGHGLAYLDRCVKAGLAVDRVAPRMSFFFAAQMDLLEEVAKFRAARRLWARLVRERFRGDDASCRLRFHTQTAGAALTASQPEVNAVRVTLQALAAVLGGTQSLHTNSRDEALGLPTEESVLLALRTQQVIAEESGVADVVDPLGGAPLIERETDRVEAEARELLRQMDAQGGPVEAARKGWTQARIAESAYRHQRAVESGDIAVVGVNRHTDVAGDARRPETLRVSDAARDVLVEDLRRRREARDVKRLDEALFGLELEAGWGPGPKGLVPAILRAVEAEATVGEICRSLEKSFGTFDPSRP
jgi:methylmalonyl-CoA mutase N-terminal domain/subunit